MFEPTPYPLIFHNTKAKLYSDGTVKITVCSDPIFRESGWEERCREPPTDFVSKPKNMANEVRKDSMHRAKSKVFDIAAENDFMYFITWTLDKEKIDRYNSSEVSKKLKTFLDNYSRRYGLKYLIIPEYHKDGAIHMHGLISGDIKLVDSGIKTKDCKTIYNMPQWKLGFSTAIEITGDKQNVAKYITKYISKDFKKIFGSFYYAGGKGLKRSPSVILYDTDYEKFNCKEFTKPNIKLAFKYQTITN